MDDVAVVERPARYGDYKGALRWFVTKDGIPMGAMFDFFLPGKLRQPYPFAKGQGDGFATEQEAKEQFKKLQAHVACVLALPARERPGSSATWR